jgi:hypothetical protein
MADGPGFKLEKITQVCLVVEDIDKMVEAHWRRFGIGPWRILTFDSANCASCTYMGKPARFRMRFALADVAGLTLEMVQHLEGDTIYKDYLKRAGVGVQHLGTNVANLDEAVARMEALGYKALMTARGFGKSRDGHFAYMGTEEELGTVWELVQAPTVRFDPDRIYPAQ